MWSVQSGFLLRRGRGPCLVPVYSPAILPCVDGVHVHPRVCLWASNGHHAHFLKGLIFCWYKPPVGLRASSCLGGKGGGARPVRTRGFPGLDPLTAGAGCGCVARPVDMAGVAREDQGVASVPRELGGVPRVPTSPYLAAVGPGTTVPHSLGRGPATPDTTGPLCVLLIVLSDGCLVYT